MHELVAHPHGEVFVLIHDRAVSLAIVAAIVTGLDQRPRLLLFLGLGFDEFLDVGMVILERIHLRRAPGLAAGFHRGRDLVVDAQEGKGPLGLPPPLSFSRVERRWKDRCPCRCRT